MDVRGELALLREFGYTHLDLQGSPVAQSRGFAAADAAQPSDRATEQTFDELRTLAHDCTKCRLAGTRTNVVFGVGNPNADLMFIGEAPGRDEDIQGEPFVGRAGQLLTDIVKAMKLTRDDVYIANVIKCRPPENRNPEPDELDACRPFIRRQVELIQPKVIVTLGRFALRDSVRLGSRVEVPLASKLTTGFVVGLLDEVTVEQSKLKNIRAVLDDEEPALIPEIIELCRWAAEYYIAPLGEMLRVSLPANRASRGKRQAVLVDPDSDQILDSDRTLIEELQRRPLPLSAIFDDLNISRSAVARLRDAGVIALHERFRDAEGVRYDRFVVLETMPGGLTPRQQAAVDVLQSRGGELSVRAMEHAGASAAVLSALAKKGVIRIERRARRHTLDAFLAGLDDAAAGEIRYSAEQRAAIEAVRATLGTFAPFLLEGVTGR